MLGNHHRVHLVIQSTLTINAVITWVTHHISPEAEAIAFMLSGIAAAWACDIERKLRHPHFWIQFKKLKEKEEEHEEAA